MTGSPLINLGELSKPATVLVEKISDAVGGVFKPYQIVRVAKAQAEAEKIQAQAKIEVTDLQRRAMQRFLEEEGKRQANIESITQKALPLLGPESSPDKMSDDWITNFFDKCRIVSDKEMQQLWAEVLASEANSPGAFSRRTVNLLQDLDKQDAELFTAICAFGWRHSSYENLLYPAIFNLRDSIYISKSLYFSTLTQLDVLGLIRYDSLGGIRLGGQSKQITVSYLGRSVQVTFPADGENELKLGYVVLTQAGQELARICNPQKVDGFFQYVIDYWKIQNPSAEFLPSPEDAPAI